MAGDEADKSATVAQGGAEGARQEAEVFAALGSLLGVLEVITTDDSFEISEPQAARIRSALSYGQRVQQYVEALLTLASEDLEVRLRPARSKLRPLLEHAIRGALRGAGGDVSLRFPNDAGWGGEVVIIDVSRVDRALNALATQLVAELGRGVIAVEVEPRDGFVRVRMRAEPAAESKVASVPHSTLLLRAAQKLFALHGGDLVVEDAARAFVACLPIAP